LAADSDQYIGVGKTWEGKWLIYKVGKAEVVKGRGGQGRGGQGRGGRRLRWSRARWSKAEVVKGEVVKGEVVKGDVGEGEVLETVGNLGHLYRDQSKLAEAEQIGR
jgi:hypothetical protein